MNPDHPPHHASMSLPDVSVELDGYMALSNVAFDAGAGILMGVSVPTEPVRAPCSMQLPVSPPCSPGESNP